MPSGHPIATLAVVLLGAIVGSFLNVVVYRLPLGLSVGSPRWSFCPRCRRPIRPRHNVPILGWLWLGGRCHECGAAISMLYPLTECANALLFLMVFDALVCARVVAPITSLASDWPIVAAYLALFAGLLVTSIMDVESYSVDIRVLILVMAVGWVGHALWGSHNMGSGPTGSTPLPPGLCLAGAAAGIAWLASHLWRSRRAAGSDQGTADDDRSVAPKSAETPPPADEAQPERPIHRWPIVLFFALLAALAVWIAARPDWRFTSRFPPYAARGLLGGGALLLMLIAASTVHRESDEEVVREIESRRSGARRQALAELGSLWVGIAVGVAAFFLARRMGWMGPNWSAVVGSGGGGLLRSSGGAAEAVGATVACASLGWLVRIGGTLAFGKEAFATGDIYILAAMGSVAGFWPVLFAFFLGATLGLLGVTLIIFHKRSRAIPFGPWLGIGMYASLWLQDPLLQVFAPAGRLLWSTILGEPRPVMGG